MAQHQHLDTPTEVAGSIVCALVASIGEKREQVENILVQYQLNNPQPEAWYSMEDYLCVLAIISEKMGPHWLFNLGKGIVANETARQRDLDKALQYLDSLHHSAADSKEFYRLISYNQDKKEARVECRNPFPCYFDRGVLASVFRNCQGNEIQSVHVALEQHRPNRLAGADVSYYTIMWQ